MTAEIGPRSLLAMLAVAALAGCASPPDRPPPPTVETRPPPLRGVNLRAAASRALQAIEAVLRVSVPASSVTPVVVTRAEMESALTDELRPQVNFLHPGASLQARDMLLRATAKASAQSIIARYSPKRRQILVAMENLSSQMSAAGLPTDRNTSQAFLTLVLAHEQVHAIDDERHDLADLYGSVRDAEALRALGMVVEGRAVHYARLAAEELRLPDAVRTFLPGAHGPLNARRAKFLLTYGHGADFVAQVEDAGGRKLADRILEAPPRFTSTVFHPDRYDASGERPLPDPVAMLREAEFQGAAAASELDLRARWMDQLGGERVRSAFSGYIAGAGVQNKSFGVSLSLHESAEAAESYARALRSIYGMNEADETGSRPEGAVAVVRRGRAVSGALEETGAKEAALRALRSAGDFAEE